MKYIFVVLFCCYFRKNSPRQGIEPWSPAWQAGILTTILSRTGSWWSSSLIVSTRQKQIESWLILFFFGIFQGNVANLLLGWQMLLWFNYTPRAMSKNSTCRSKPDTSTSALGFLHSRTNLSPFTKDFRGGDQFDEYLAIFLRSGLVRTDHYQRNIVVQTWCHLFLAPPSGRLAQSVRASC